MVEYKVIVPPYYNTLATTLLLPRYCSLFLSSCSFSFCFATCPFFLFLSLVFYLIILLWFLIFCKYFSYWLSKLIQVIINQRENDKVFWAIVCFFFVVLWVLVSLSVSVITRFILCVLKDFEYERILSSCYNV
jgi:hypothetical protein